MTEQELKLENINLKLQLLEAQGKYLQLQYNILVKEKEELEKTQEE